MASPSINLDDLYPSGIFPDGMELPTSGFGIGTYFPTTSGNLSSEDGMVYPIAVPRIDSGSTSGQPSGNSYIVPYSAQMFWAALSSIKKEYETRGATEPTFHAYIDASGLIREEIVNHSGLLAMPLQNFHYLISDAYTAISGLICMPEWIDTFTDYMSRVFDYRILMSGVLPENRLSDNVSYYSTLDGANKVINPLSRARSGDWPLSLEDVKHLGSIWGVAIDGTRRYGSEVFTPNPAGSGAHNLSWTPNPPREQEFQQYAFMGHFDWLIQSIMWRAPFVETLSKNQAEDTALLNYYRGGLPPTFTEPSGFTGDPTLYTPWTGYGGEIWNSSLPDTQVPPTYKNDALAEADIIGPVTTSATDYGNIYISNPIMVRNMPITTDRFDQYPYSADDEETPEIERHRRFAHTAQVGFIGPQNDWDGENPNGKISKQDWDTQIWYNIKKSIDSNGNNISLASQKAYMATYEAGKKHARSRHSPNPGNGEVVTIFEQVKVSSSEGSLVVNMKDYFATGPNSAYGFHSNYVTSYDSSTDTNNGHKFTNAWPLNHGGFGRLSQIDNGFSFPAILDPRPFTNWPPYIDIATFEAAHPVIETDTFNEPLPPSEWYRHVSVADAGRFWWQWHYHIANSFPQTELTIDHLVPLNSTFTGPLYGVFGAFSRIGVNDEDAWPDPRFNHYNMTAPEWDHMKSLLTNAEPIEPTQYIHGAYEASGYYPTSHPMQSVVTWQPEREKWSYPMGVGSELRIDVSMSSRPPIPASVTNLTGRQDWDGLHFVFSTSSHIPTQMTPSAEVASSDYTVRGIFNHVKKRIGNNGRINGEFDEYDPVVAGTEYRLGMRIDPDSNTPNFGESDYLPVDASGARASGWTYSYGVPNLLQEYWTKGGWAPNVVGTTPFQVHSRGVYKTVRKGEDERKSQWYADDGELDFPFDRTYVTYGDFPTVHQGVAENYTYEDLGKGDQYADPEVWSPWTNGPRDLPTTSEIIPSGAFNTHLKIEDTAPTSGTIYNIDMWTPFKKDMDNLAKAWEGAYYGADMLAFWDENDHSAVPVGTIPSMRNAVASSGNDPGATPAFGYYEGDGLGIELENITFVDLAMAVEKVGMGAAGVGYTLNNFWLKFPVILGPSGVE